MCLRALRKRHSHNQTSIFFEVSWGESVLQFSSNCFRKAVLDLGFLLNRSLPVAPDSFWHPKCPDLGVAVRTINYLVGTGTAPMDGSARKPSVWTGSKSL